MSPDESPRGRDARTPYGSTPVEQPFDERRVAAWIGKAITMKGDVVCSRDLTIDGVVEGTIEVGQHSLPRVLTIDKAKVRWRFDLRRIEPIRIPIETSDL